MKVVGVRSLSAANPYNFVRDCSPTMVEHIFIIEYGGEIKAEKWPEEYPGELDYVYYNPNSYGNTPYLLRWSSNRCGENSEYTTWFIDSVTKHVFVRADGTKYCMAESTNGHHTQMLPC